MNYRRRRLGLVIWLLVPMIFGQSLLSGGGIPEAKAAPVFHLPWEAGSVWQITYDGGAGHHADQWNRYALDAVPAPGRSTRQVTAIADGHVLGFQNDVPNEPRTPGPHAGNCMLIRHDDGSVSLYAHLASGSIPAELRSDGAEVRSGMVIGTVGMSGYSFGEHLHWSLTNDGHMYEQYGYRTCLGTSIPSQYADNDRELIEDGGVPRPGRYYESTNIVQSSAQEPPAPTVAPVEVAPTEAPAASDVAPSVETASMDIGAYGPDGHAIGAQFTVTTTDGSFLGSCTLEGNAAEQHLVTCEVPVPRGTIVQVTLDESTIPAGLVPVENPLMFDTSGDPGVASSWGVTFQLQPQNSRGGNGSTSDVAIVTTENGQPVYDACFVLVNFSNEGCDRNSDGKITFEDVPLGTYTLRQTADLGPGRAVQDSTIVVTGAVGGDGWERFPVSVGSGQSSGSGGASDLAIVTTENGQPVYDVCYVLVNFSNEGCDRNSDGKITFEDVPVGTYTLRQTATLGLGRSIPDTVVQVTGVTDADGWERIHVTVNGDDSTVPLAPSNTVTGTIMLITLRGCPENFNPSTGNFAAECTVPLDAPNNAFVDHGGEGQGGWFISQLDRQYDGTYVYTANPDTMNIKLRNLEPSVRDAFEVVGADFAEGDVYTINLDEGETRKIYVYYYYAQ